MISCNLKEVMNWLDNVDIRILELLQLDGRMTLSDLSKQLSLSRPSVADRIRRLEDRQIIEGYTARISLKAVGRGILVFIQMSELQVACHEFEKIAKKEQDILECHRITGAASYLIKAAVASMEKLEALVDRLIPYGRVHTSIRLSSPVAHRHVTPGVAEEEI